MQFLSRESFAIALSRSSRRSRQIQIYHKTQRARGKPFRHGFAGHQVFLPRTLPGADIIPRATSEINRHHLVACCSGRHPGNGRVRYPGREKSQDFGEYTAIPVYATFLPAVSWFGRDVPGFSTSTSKPLSSVTTLLYFGKLCVARVARFPDERCVSINCEKSISRRISAL